MNLINVEQGSAEWLALRKEKIGASEVSIVLDCNPWMSPLKLWRQKLGLDPATEENEAMREGKRKEPLALKAFNEQKGLNCVPAVGMNPAFPWLIASLDGWNGEQALEIKCGGQKLYDDALIGVIPEYYNIQMQTQMIVFGLFKMFYFVYLDEQSICLEVERDIQLCTEIVKESKKFWDMVQNLEAPALTDKDYVQREDDNWLLISSEWKEYARMKNHYEELEKRCRYRLIECCAGQSSQGAGIRLSRIVSKGRMDYDQMIEDYGIKDLEKYRKEPIESFRIAEIKEK